MSEPRRVLVVGAGATGQLVGAALAGDGCAVSFLLRTARTDPLPLHVVKLPMRALAQVRGREWFCTCTSFGSVADAASAGPWDAVFLAVAAPALRGSWLPALLAGGCASSAAVVFIAGGVAGSERSLLLAAGAAEEQLLQLGFAAIAWQAPLPSLQTSLAATAASAPSTPPTSIECVVPAPLQLAGATSLAAPLAAAMRSGGLPCTVVKPSAADELIFADAVLLPLCAALACVDWSFRSLAADATLRRLAAGASRECIGAAQLVTPSLPWRLLVHCIRGWLLLLIVTLAPLVLPFDLEAYLCHHFCAKPGVRGQVDLFLAAFELQGANAPRNGASVPMPALHELRQRQADALARRKAKDK